MRPRQRPHHLPSLPLRLCLAACVALTAASVGQAQTAQTAPAAAAPAASAPLDPGLRPQWAAPLAQAQELLRSGSYREALAQVALAEAVPSPTPYELYIIRRLKSTALLGAGETEQTLPLFEALLGDPLLPGADRRLMAETLIKQSLRGKDFGRAARWMKQYLGEGGPDPEIRRLYPQVLFQAGDKPGAAKAFTELVAAEEAAGRVPTEQLLRMLAASRMEVQDDAGYLEALQRLAVTTGKTDYWSELIQRTVRRPGFATERLQLDVYRLYRAAGLALSAGQLGDMAHRANQAGLPAEAQALLDEGFNGSVLGTDGNAAADRRLREAATKAAAQDRATAADSEAGLRNAKDGNAAYGLGLALSGAGQHEKAVALIGQGLAKGGLRRPNDAQLHLGLAQWRAGKVADAIKSFDAVGGTDGTAELARLWSALLKRPQPRT